MTGTLIRERHLVQEPKGKVTGKSLAVMNCRAVTAMCYQTTQKSASYRDLLYLEIVHVLGCEIACPESLGVQYLVM